MTEEAKASFWNKVHKSDGCWLWTAGRTTNGYGRFSLNGRMKYAHRLSWRMHNGPIPAGMHVLHKCDVPHCVNPDHLFIGTNLDNVRDRDRKGRQARQKGMKHGQAKLTREQVREIREKHVPYKYSTYKLADEYGVSPAQIHHIVTRKSWTHI